MLPENPPGPLKGSDLTPDNDPAMAERRMKAVQLRTAGFTYRQIGKALGISHTAAHKLVMKEIREARTLTREKADEMRQMAHNRLETMVNRLWLKAMPQDPTQELDLYAMDRIIRLMVFHARLMGYEEPQKFQVDINEVRVQFGVIVEKIAKVIPEESAPRVLEVLEDCLKDMETKQIESKGMPKVKYDDVVDVQAIEK